MLLQRGIILVVQCAVTLAGSENLGFYRCMWSGAGGGVTTQRSMTSGHLQTRMCFRSDSEKMTAYINYCTGQHYTPLRACHDNGTWNCDSFVSFCKTVVLSEPRIPEVIQTKPQRRQQQQPTLRTQANTGDGWSDPASVCPPASSYFSLKEMAVAVLVSFIVGAALLTIFIIVIWRYRHTKWESQWNKQHQQKTQRMAALHAITQIAHAFRSHSDVEHTSSFINPNYAQVIASNMVLEDVLTETDRVYEEISNRRRSSAKSATSDNLYTKVNKAKSKIFKSASVASDLSSVSEEIHNFINGLVCDPDDKSKQDEASNVTVTSKCDSGYIDEVCSDSGKEKIDTENDKVEAKEAVPNDTDGIVYENSRKMSFKF